MGTTTQLYWGDGYLKIRMSMIPESLRKELRYWHRDMQFDPQAGKQVMVGEYRNLFTEQPVVDDKQQVVQELLTMSGFMYRVKKLLVAMGVEYTIIDERTPRPPFNMNRALSGLRDYQWEGTHVALHSGGGIIACPTGWGKCLGPDTDILYADGSIRKIDTVAIGDYLMGDDSTPRLVTKRIDGSGPMYRITPNNGVPFDVADDHILCLIKSGTCKRDKHPDGHVIHITLSDYLKASDTFKHRYKLYKVAVNWTKSNVPIDPYWLGLWLGDGNYDRPVITTVDTNIADYVHDYASTLGLKCAVYSASGKAPRYGIVGDKGKRNSLLLAMRDCGLLTSRDKFIPEQFIVNDRRTRLQLLAGLLDSDGHLGSNTVFEFTNTNKGMTAQVAFLARSLGLRVHHTSRMCKGFGIEVLTYRLRISGDTHLIPTLLARKQASTRRQIKCPLRTAFSVTQVPDSRYVGVQLDGNHRYVLGDCTVTHNTHIMASLVDAYDHADLCARNTPLTVIACSDKDIIAKNYKDIKAILPHRDVQLITGDNADYSADVQCITLDSLKKLNPEEIGILIVDEVHSAATPSRSEHLLAATKAIVWGLSATPTGRFDGSDLVTEGIHGPVVYRRTYQQGVEVGALVPINVYFVRVPEPAIGMKRYSNYKTRRGKYNQAVIKGSVQNGIVADLLKGIPDSLQTLCIMQQTGQMNEIVGLLPDIDYVHAKTNDKELQKMSQFNLVGIKAKERAKIYKNMANGTTRKILSTHVYKQGVDFPELSVMICPGGGGSDIAAAQVPGRASRKIEGKDSSILIDFWHDWDVVEKNGRKNQGPILKDDRSRDRVYESLGFNRYWVDSVEDLLTIINAV